MSGKIYTNPEREIHHVVYHFLAGEAKQGRIPEDWNIDKIATAFAMLIMMGVVTKEQFVTKYHDTIEKTDAMGDVFMRFITNYTEAVKRADCTNRIEAFIKSLLTPQHEILLPAPTQTSIFTYNLCQWHEQQRQETTP